MSNCQAIISKPHAFAHIIPSTWSAKDMSDLVTASTAQGKGDRRLMGGGGGLQVALPTRVFGKGLLRGGLSTGGRR